MKNRNYQIITGCKPYRYVFTSATTLIVNFSNMKNNFFY